MKENNRVELLKDGFISFNEALPAKNSLVLLYFEDINNYFIDYTNDYYITDKTEYFCEKEDGGGNMYPTYWKYLIKDYKPYYRIAWNADRQYFADMKDINEKTNECNEIGGEN